LVEGFKNKTAICTKLKKLCSHIQMKDNRIKNSMQKIINPIA